MIDICPKEWSINPISTCRDFDFSLGFEFYVLSLIPSLIFIIFGITRVISLFSSPQLLPTFNKSSTTAKLLYLIKILSGIAFAASNLAALILWCKNDYETSSSSHSTISCAIVTLSFTFLASLVVVINSHFQHFKSTRSDFILPFFLFATTLCDIPRLRTFQNTGFTTGSYNSFYIAFTIAYSFRVILLIVENINKGFIIKQLTGLDNLAPESVAPFFSRLTLAWNTAQLIRGARIKLTIENLDPISKEFDSPDLYSIGNLKFQKEVKKSSSYPLLKTLLFAFPATLISPVFPCIICSLAYITQPILINSTIKFIDSYTTGGSNQAVAEGYGLAVAFLLVGIIFAISQSLWHLNINRGMVMIRGYLLEAVYRKSTRIHVEVTKSTGSGKASNLMSVDTERILERIENVFELLNAFIIISLGFYLLYQQIGLAFLASLISVAFMIVATPPLSKPVGPAQLFWSNSSDSRVKVIASVLKQIRAVKLCAWEDVLIKRITAAREFEVRAFIKLMWHSTKVVVLSNYGSNLQSLATLTTYAIMTFINPSLPPLGTARIFTVVSILSLIGSPLNSLGQSFSGIVAAWESLIRIETFLLEKESTAVEILSSTSKYEAPDIVLESATFSVGEIKLLEDISTVIEAGTKTFVIGRVGSGKSTFLHGLLNEVDSNQTVTTSRTAFCSQDAWLRSTDSIRSAIIFLSDFDTHWYNIVIKAVALDTDLEVISNGDAALVSGLSGGQRQRVAIARALYSRAERYIFDDSFSALDSSTSDHVFDALFGEKDGLLLNRTVILATNDIHHLLSSEKIIVLASGKIVEQGTYDQLLLSQGSMYQLIQDFAVESRGIVLKESNTQESIEAVEKEELSEEETEDEGGKGSIGWGAYRAYGRGVGWKNCIFYLCLSLVNGAMPLITQIYLQYWSAAVVNNASSTLLRYLGGYIGLEIFALILITSWFMFAAMYAAPLASRALHRGALNGVLNSPLSFVDKVGLGKVLNRFSSDMNLIDQELPSALLNLLGNAIGVLAGIFVIIAATPFVALIILGIIILFAGIQYFYTKTSQQLRRLDLGSRSPLYSLMSDTVDADGIMTIRAFSGGIEHFILLNSKRTQRSQKPYYSMNIARRQLNSVLDICAALINASLVAIAISRRNSVQAEIFAVALVQATFLTNNLNRAFVAWVEVEICVVAAERIQEFAILPPEESEVFDKDEKDKSSWLKTGTISFENVSVRYAPELDLALKNVSFEVKAGSRVGICGRSGGGKSTLLATLFRMLDIENGKILIDGIDISTIPRRKERGGLSIIPQDPLLLDISLRENLDILGIRTDEEIWDALEKSSMKSKVENLPLKLNENVSGTFSRGERQLLALARAILEDRKILCLDEATSSLDIETDQQIQTILRTSTFQFSTIITIAHRIATIIDYDQILVLNAGEVVENGTPEELMEKEGGWFRKLVRGVE